MKLADIFTEHNIIPELAATQKEEAIREIVARLCSNGSVTQGDAAGVKRALMRREELGTTGIGKGVAVPHAKHAGVKGVVGAFACSSQGVEFNALDGQPVHLIFLLISSPDAVEPHLEALRKVTTLLKDDVFCAFLRRAKDLDELADLLREADERFAG